MTLAFYREITLPKMMKLKLLTHSFLLGTFISACSPETSKNGIIEAEENFELTPALKKCAKKPSCEDHAAALFWVSAMAMSDLSKTEIDVNWNELDHNERLDLVDNIRSINESDYDAPEYDTTSRSFLKAYAQMKRSHELGNAFASNELGLLHFENPNFRDFDLAVIYLKAAEKNGDPFGSYNLARLYLTGSKRDDTLAIESMGKAAAKSVYFRYFHVRLQMELDSEYQATEEEIEFVQSKTGREEESDWRNHIKPHIR